MPPADVDDFYFAEVNTPEKAYILGLMITDGWIRSDGRPEVGIQLIEEDTNIIEFIKAQWKSTRKILVLDKGDFIGANGKKYAASKMARIVVQSTRMWSDLYSHGVAPNKTRSTWMPLLDYSVMPHLIRGVIDGDGTIYRHGETGQPCVRFVGSPFLVSQIAMYLTMKIGVGYRNPSLVRGSDFLSYVDYSIGKDVLRILRYAYENAPISIKRKQKHAENIFSQASRS